LSVSAIRDGDSILFVGFLRDISPRIELRRARDELARITQIIATDEIAASIAHEINQPLAAIATNGSAGLRWLETMPPDLHEVRLALRRIVNDGHHASEVIAGIRSMFRKDNQARGTQDLNELIREVLTLVRVEMDEQRVSAFTELFDALPVIQANYVQLRQVIVNLVRNAIDAMGAVEGRPRVLRLKTESQGPDHVRVTINDSGTGIDPRNIDRIFNAFFTTKPHGMGMGLSICRSIIEGHGGRLSVVAGQPHGSIFHLSLPIRAIDSPAAATPVFDS
jgi:C4-dicarboxylate-specific signal transduction histidine kinase